MHLKKKKKLFKSPFLKIVLLIISNFIVGNMNIILKLRTDKDQAHLLKAFFFFFFNKSDLISQ